MTGAASHSRDLQPVTENSTLLSLYEGRSMGERNLRKIQGFPHEAEQTGASPQEKRQPQERQRRLLAGRGTNCGRETGQQGTRTRDSDRDARMQ